MEFLIAVICGVLGFFIGGVIGEVHTIAHAWFPHAWYGLIIGLVLGIGGCACCIDGFNFD